MSTIVENPLTNALIDGDSIEDDCKWCGGTLKQKGDWRVCAECCMTPSGTFIDAPRDSNENEDERDRYYHSELVIQYGGFAKAYNDDGEYSFSELGDDTLLHY